MTSNPANVTSNVLNMLHEMHIPIGKAEDKLGLSRGYLHRMKDREPKLSTAMRIGKLFNLSVEELSLPEEDFMKLVRDRY